MGDEVKKISLNIGSGAPLIPLDFYELSEANSEEGVDEGGIDWGGGAGETKYLLLGLGGAVTLSSFLLKRPKQPRWDWDGNTFLAGKGLSKETWQTASDYGIFGIHGGVIGYYTFQLIDDHESAQDRALGLVAAYLLTRGTARWTKKLGARERPDRSDNQSFFSGHASSSAVLAVYISADLIHTYGDDHPKLVIFVVSGNLVSALFVGAARVGGNKHYTTDVVTGLGVGAVFALLSAHFFINNEDDGTENKPSGEMGLIGAGAGTLVGVGTEFVRSKLFSKSAKKFSLLPQGPSGSSGLTLVINF